jgi:hypothetical protein
VVKQYGLSNAIKKWSGWLELEAQVGRDFGVNGNEGRRKGCRNMMRGRKVFKREKFSRTGRVIRCMAS